MRAPRQFKIKWGLFMNQGCKFTDQERLRVPRPAPSLCVRQQLFGLAARWAARAVLVTAPKVGMQGFLQLLTWIQSLFSSHQQCSRPSTHFHSSKLHSDTRRGLKPVNSSLNLPPCQALLPEDRNPTGGIQGMRRTCRPWWDQELSLEEPKFLLIPEAS